MKKLALGALFAGLVACGGEGKPKPMIQSQADAGPATASTPNCAAKAAMYRTREMIQTIIVGALPEFFMGSALRFEGDRQYRPGR